MRVLFDQGTPAPLRLKLTGHSIETAYERGWSTLKNGELISAAESEGFDVFVTTDKSPRHQQNPVGRKIAIVVLHTTSWPQLQRAVQRVIDAVNAATAGSYAES